MFRTLRALDLMREALVLHELGYQTNCLAHVARSEDADVKSALICLLHSSHHMKRCLVVREADVVIAIREITCLH